MIKHLLIILLVSLAGCATLQRAKPAAPAATTKPAPPPLAAPPMANITPPEPDPSRPYYPHADLVPGYVVDPVWPAGRLKEPWGPVAGITIDGNGNVWTLNRGNMPVQVFTPEGRIMQAWPATNITSGHQIRIDREGNIWIADYRAHAVRKFDRSGNPLLTIGVPGQAGTDEKHFNLPTDVAITSNGDVFISDGYANNRIVHCDAKGNFVKAWGKLGIGDGEFSLPHSIVMDSKGLLYVADRNNNRIQVFDQSGKFIRAWRGQMVPWTLCITPRDELYAVGSSPMRWNANEIMVGMPPKDQIVVRMTTDFRVLSWWTFPFQPDSTKFKPGDLNWVHAVAVDTDGNLFLGDVNGARIQKFWLAKPSTTTEPPGASSTTQP
jgi:sugar lactone lactonase YvrE